MGYKSRGGWNLNYCMKTDCKNRGQCDDCFRFSLYEAVNEDGGKDQDYEENTRQ
jgi:hypothetical protein